MSLPLKRKSHSERTDLSDSKMVDSAIKLIVEKGSDKTTLKEVGELAGYSRGLAGYRFGSKAGLFEFIIRSVGEQWVNRMTRVTHGKQGFDAISSALDEHAAMCLEASAPIRAFYILWFESIGVQSKVKDLIATIHERRRNDVISWLQNSRLHSSQTAEDIAGQFIASVLGIAYHWLSNPEDHAGLVKLHQNLKKTMQLNFVQLDLF